MHIGLVGLGKMGGNMRERLRGEGFVVSGYTRNQKNSDYPSLEDMVKSLPAPRIVWVMVTAGEATDAMIDRLSTILEPGDLLVDGGNSRFTEDIRHAKILEDKKIEFVDCGVSGGIWGLDNGYGLMAGGSKENIAKLMPVFDALRPAGPREESFVHAGGIGSGHYAKMVHNGIEYGIMQAYAEGYELLEKKDIVENVPAVFKAWQRGTVVRSWLLELLVDALQKDPHFDEIQGYVEDSGEGRWTVEEAINLSVPVPVIATSLFARFSSRQEESPAMKALAALRNEFGGHSVKKKTDDG